jgi:hypothetical protein
MILQMRQRLIFDVLCLFIAVVALGFAGWTVVSGQIHKQGIDALFLVAVCLLIVLVFAPMPVAALRRGELQQWLKRRHEAKQPATTVESPDSSEKVKQHSV